MTEFSAQQLPIIARRVLAERDSGREVDPYRIAWASDIIAFFDRGDKEAGKRVFVDDRERLAADPRFAAWAAGSAA